MKTNTPRRMMDVLVYVSRNNGCEQKDVLSAVYKHIADKNYGRQSPASSSIAELRRRGLLEDDCDRCPHCGRAARGRRNVPLTITEAGRKLARKIRLGFISR